MSVNIHGNLLSRIKDELIKNNGTLNYTELRKRVKCSGARLDTALMEMVQLRIINRRVKMEYRGGYENISIANPEDSLNEIEWGRWATAKPINFGSLYSEVLGKIDLSRPNIAGCSKAEEEYDRSYLLRG